MKSIKSIDDFLSLKNILPEENKGNAFNYYFESFADYKNFDFNSLMKFKYHKTKIDELKIYSACLKIEEIYKNTPNLTGFNVFYTEKDSLIDIVTYDKEGNINYNWDDLKNNLYQLYEYIDVNNHKSFKDIFNISDRNKRFLAYEKMTNGFIFQKNFLNFIENNEIKHKQKEGFFIENIFSVDYPLFPAEALKANFNYYEILNKIDEISPISVAIKLLHLSGYITILHDFFSTLKDEECLVINTSNTRKYFNIDYDIKNKQGESINNEKINYYKNSLYMLNRSYFPNLGRDLFCLIFDSQYYQQFEEKNRHYSELFTEIESPKGKMIFEIEHRENDLNKEIEYKYEKGDWHNLIHFSISLLKTAYNEDNGMVLENWGNDIVLQQIPIYQSIIEKNLILNKMDNETISDNVKNSKRL